MSPLTVYNSLSRKKEVFEPLNPGFVGLYVCGPTVYNPVHLGNCRTFVSFDIIYRYLVYKGWKVRYVRNITDAGHLTDDGEDRMARGARLEQLEPMEVAHKYTNDFHDKMRVFNNHSPDIEPTATGHIIEQIEMVKQIIANGYGYEVDGSVYFDVTAYNAANSNRYGELSGRKIDELMVESRELKGQDQKRSPQDFAIWMKAQPETLQRWPSPWGEGFPGWHLECSAMSTKYLGQTFDIHGGGNDLKFPHHENEIAQNVGCCSDKDCSGGARYWLHTNMLLMNGRKMSKSDGNTISPDELFSGESPHVSQGYSPMVVRFFMLQAHYRSTMDITDDALQAALKGYNRLMEGYQKLQELEAKGTAQNETVGKQLREHMDAAWADMDDDFNTPKALAKVFELVSKVNALHAGQLSLDEVSAETLADVKMHLYDLVFNVFGLKNDLTGGANNKTTEALDGVLKLVLDLRQQARAEKNWAVSDQIRDQLAAAGVEIKDGKEGASWSLG
ncbi:MAG: cysteine--tRNA ligase [Bacteroidota bacterium]